ncbi:lipase family protein [Rhodococcus sp. NPDC058521]|uniref:lipase family protein n=1 Tax=Rhodococcus sp. NPDC058521 TaxID=3346536 RepID=UPI0036564383
MKSNFRLRVGAVVAAAALAVGAMAGSASAAPVHPGDVFNPFVISTFEDGRLADPSHLLPMLPTDDPFYQVPPGATDAPAGTLLKFRPATIQVWGVQPGNVRGYQMMYVTTDFDGSRTVSTGLLMIPEDGTAPQDRKLVGYSEANDSLGPNCMPSYQWTGGNQTDPSLTSALGPVAQMFGKGWAVMMSDTANDGDPAPNGFSIGRFSGAATLDGLRAAIAIPDAQFAPEIPIGLFGIAGGGVAAGFAAEKAADYAPELNIVGTVLESMVIDSRTFEEKADGGIGAGFVFANALGFAAKYPEIDLDRELTPLGRTMADIYNQTCQLNYLFTPFVPLSALFVNGRPSDNPAFARAYEENTMGQSAPNAPVLMASCRDDFLVPYSDVEKLIAAYRAGGTEVTVEPAKSCGITDLADPYRMGTELLGMQNIPWLEQRFEAASR